MPRSGTGVLLVALFTAAPGGAGFVRAGLLCTVTALVIKPALDHWA